MLKKEVARGLWIKPAQESSLNDEEHRPMNLLFDCTVQWLCTQSLVNNSRIIGLLDTLFCIKPLTSRTLLDAMSSAI
eukprot:3168170-Amphidinium_carterae.1